MLGDEGAISWETIGSLVPYWAFMLVTAGGFYRSMIFVSGHLTEDFKKELSLWLDGFYEISWSEQFCRLFDTVLGERHFSIKRFVRSSIASVLSVFALYVLFAHVLGVLGSRTFGSMPVWQALLAGAAINVIPDYLSLIETRWLLERFGKHSSVVGQVVLLVADLIFSAAIVVAGIYAYAWLSGDRIPSPVELVALFSVYSVFFYSTFLTSAWAWVYCLSAWFVRLFSKAGLRKILDVKKDPMKQIALVGAVVMALCGTAIGPALSPEKGGFSFGLDDLFCSLDSNACFLAARNSDDIERVASLMQMACASESYSENCAEHLETEFSQADIVRISAVWKQACDGGYARACRAYGWHLWQGYGERKNTDLASGYFEKACNLDDYISCGNLAVMYEGDGLPSTPEKAISYYGKACDGGAYWACTNLGFIYEKGLPSIRIDPPKAALLYSRGCNGGDLRGCNNFGLMVQKGYSGVAGDAGKAASLHQQSCDGGYVKGCADLGFLYLSKVGGIEFRPKQAVELLSGACTEGYSLACLQLGTFYKSGVEVPQNLGKAISLFELACNQGYPAACGRLGYELEVGTGGNERDISRAAQLYKQACGGDDAYGCLNFGRMLESGAGGVGQNAEQAVAKYQQACDLGNMYGCTALGTMVESGKGTRPDPAEAIALYQRACDGNDAKGCAFLGTMYEYGVGTKTDPDRATALYAQACKGGWQEACSWKVEWWRLWVGHLSKAIEKRGQ